MASWNKCIKRRTNKSIKVNKYHEFIECYLKRVE